ncbi:hypothetical protein [Pantoea stewartii]|uniref:Phage protein n=1 Tax=Pantoea stewartii subsp. stewartii DC283 TaxID=660596 RepID=H3R9Q0_PANSE|nr:hypothetical protein [Pantoea stewartii]ARF51360.1 hypothetical protein DSJ_19925 [Pantoea stewartii subsp. stewartii DC283]EHU01913.1 hypothetical protein CKS_0381 [Pantoea stewartii subsp. stewartii DC283]KAB0549298.1 hypothetical protein F7Q90_19930 [Pantoea stewartii subsp. stewartii]
MAAKLEVIITEQNGRMEFDIKGSGGRTPREEARLVMIIAAIKALFSDSDRQAAKCNCPACKESREREAENERPNLH